jgi:N-acetylglucosamine malate deacetylase 1
MFLNLNITKMSTILIFCAHSDDEAIGMGGTIAKYIKQKKKIIKVVLSSGEKSIPHIQEHIVKKERKKETSKASKFIGIHQDINLHLKDTKLKKEIEKPFVVKRILEIIKTTKPQKIFVPSKLDPHPDHQAVNTIVLRVIDSQKKHYATYAYEVWNILNENNPRIYNDIALEMGIKMEYIKMFKSQWVYMFSLYIPTIIRSFYFGRKYNTKYAERFYKLR